jgi:hypothetical protein
MKPALLLLVAAIGLLGAAVGWIWPVMRTACR